MGALHEGHISLISASAQECDFTSVTVFVNPTQFGDNSDFDLYPRTEAEDFEKAEKAGAQLVFAPSAAEMYSGTGVSVRAGSAANGLEGASRPGHFDGVVSIVAKLFTLFYPDRAYFGLKDLQQCAVIQQLIDEQLFPIELRLIETLREYSGLALSSRNERLSPTDKAQASKLYHEMMEAASAAAGGQPAGQALNRLNARLETAGFQVEYTAFVDPKTMATTETPHRLSRLAAAVQLGGVRLIDNVPVI